MNTLFSEKGTAVYLVRFTGKELDPLSGLYDFGARYYDPRLSVWFGVDLMAEKNFEYTPYVYTGNNPIKFIDPDGRCPDCPDPVVPSAAGIIYETFQNARAGLFNIDARLVEMFSDTGTQTRMRVNYNEGGSIPMANPVSINEEPKNEPLAEAKDILSDVISLIPNIPGKGMSGPVLAARAPVKQTVISFIKGLEMLLRQLQLICLKDLKKLKDLDIQWGRKYIQMVSVGYLLIRQPIRAVYGNFGIMKKMLERM